MRLMHDLVGDVLSDRYRLMSRIAGGGMGDVYRGHDLLLDRTVAVKVLEPSLATDPELVARFRAEARAAARLSHPNVVAVHDWGSQDGTYYMVMEFVAGTDLRDLLVSRGSLEPAQAVEVMIAVCDALAAAHSTGLVHRDVKPENILIAQDGKVKVADFGIAIVADSERALPGSGMLGTLRYLSPEQAQGQSATRRSDIWAAGCVLGELLTGRPPLQGSGAELLRTRAMETPARPSALSPKVSDDLDEIVMRACALRPEERYEDVSDMAAELRRVAVRSVPDAPPVAALLEDLTGEIRLPDMEVTGFLADRGRVRRRRRERVRGFVRKLSMVVIAALMLAGGAKAATLILPQDVPVPSLENLRLDTAQELAAQSDLEVEVAGRVADKEVPVGQVVSQDPADGVLKEGSTISVVLSTGPPPVKVPSLVGLDEEAATARLEGRGFEIDDVKLRYSMQEEGTVVRQIPARGKLPWGSPVELVVSQGPKPIEVISVVGLAAEEAVTKLEAAGFTTSLLDVYSDDIPAGDVVSTTPGPGEVVATGATIEIAVSIGPEFEEVRMPDVRGMEVDDARARLEKLGLIVTVRDPCDGGGTMVVETDPLAGSTLRENDPVALFVC
ncbi:MAG: Stk1 family PASTA domain-containing Ser/Thr kinase [Actinomycetota bacterium]|nr:Stk1 family PASTA domain-containing Ser/Thr kinase [Actinomycetota bacterium]